MLAQEAKVTTELGTEAMYCVKHIWIVKEWLALGNRETNFYDDGSTFQRFY